MPNTDFGEGTYTFDHLRGAVFKTPDTFRNALGNFLLDAADSGRAALRRNQARNPGLRQRLSSSALLIGVDVVDAVGRKAIAYEKVGMVEATAARTALFVNREASKDPLVRQLELKRAELSNLERTGTTTGKRTLLVMDESSMTGAADAAKISALAKGIGSRNLFQGDVKQHSSVGAGRAFAQAQAAGMHTSTLKETRRFDRATPRVKEAVGLFNAGRHRQAFGSLRTREVGENELHTRVAGRYIRLTRALQRMGVNDPSVGVVVVTNADRKIINETISRDLARHGAVSAEFFDKSHLDNLKLTSAEQALTKRLRAEGVDRLVFRRTYKDLRVARDEVVRVEGYDDDRNRILGVTERGRRVEVDPTKHVHFTAMRQEQRSYSVGGQIEARAILKFDQQLNVVNGTKGVIQALDDKGATVKWFDGQMTTLDNAKLRFVDHAYARTSIKEQGATNDAEIIALGRVGALVVNRESSLVSGTRARYHAEIVTTDGAAAFHNAGRSVEKTTAADFERIPGRPAPEVAQERQERTVVPKPQREQHLER